MKVIWCSFHIPRKDLHAGSAWKRCSGQSQQSWYFCARRGGDSRAWMRSNWLTFQKAAMPRICFHKLKLDTSLYDFHRYTWKGSKCSETGAMTLSPGARCSWHEPEGQSCVWRTWGWSWFCHRAFPMVQLWNVHPQSKQVCNSGSTVWCETMKGCCGITVRN